MDPFADYERIRSENKPFERQIKGEPFEFPGACPANVAMDFLNTVISTEGRVNVDFLALRAMVDLLGEKDVERLAAVTSFPEMKAIARGLFQHYGLLREEAPAPNRAARRTSRGSKKKSSNGSARLEQTSAASTS
jgi:hypothetical protein